VNEEFARVWEKEAVIWLKVLEQCLHELTEKSLKNPVRILGHDT
jgi:hypothetical protein